MWVGIIQSIEGLNRTKMQRKGEFSSPLFSELRHLTSSSALRLGFIYIIGSSPSQAFGLLTELHHWLFWVSILQMADHGISQPP